MNDWHSVLTRFQQIWGYQNFRPPQDEVVRSLLSYQDLLVVLPTGSGKSLCFQLPAILQTGLTIVVSPLIALMENQVRDLQKRSLSAALIHSELDTLHRKLTLKAIALQQLRLVYLSPETLFTPPVWDCISQPNVKINALIIDEAHCLVQWGETFRPEYRRLGAVRPSLLHSKPAGSQIAIAAFTATATPSALEIIKHSLQLQNPQIFVSSLYRPNLHLQVKMVFTRKCRRDQLLQFIASKQQQSGLIYVRSRRTTEELALWLQSKQYPCAAYHAGLSPQQRREIEINWLDNHLQFVVCTSAFGMGIDKSDLRWVIHFHAPLFLSEYVQEVGRSGRDGQMATCLSLISEPTGWLDSQDKQRQKFFLMKLQQQYQQAQRIISEIPEQGDIDTVAKNIPGADVTLSLLDSTSQLKWLDPFSYLRTSNKSSASFGELFTRQQKQQQQMNQYLTTKSCRWQFLLNAFGFESEAKNFKCGHCDNCR